MQVTAGVHALVEHPDDFDQFGRDHAIVNDMDRSSHARFTSPGAGVLEIPLFCDC